MAYSFLAALSIWVVDSVIDSFFMNEGNFFNHLSARWSWHELYFRLFFVVTVVFCGIAISVVLSKRNRAEEELKKKSTAIETSMDGVAVYDNNDVYVYVNNAYALINGYDKPKDIIGKTCLNIYGEEEYKRMQLSVVPSLNKNGKWRGELVGKRKNGSTYFQEASVSMLEGGGRVCIVRDITWRKRNEERLHRSERFLNTIFNSIRDPFCIFDDEYRIIRVNEAYAGLKNKPISELIGRKCYELLEGMDGICKGCVVSRTFDSGDPCAKDKQVSLPDGAEIHLEIFTYPILDDEGRVSHVIEYTRDITGRKKAEEEKQRLIERLEHLSRTDSLTGLINRRALADNLLYELDRAKRYGSELSLVLCDIDNFKEVNDTSGHDAGDRALQILSALLKTILRKTDIAGRYGGDEFMLILPQTSLSGAESLADKILSEIRNADIGSRHGKQIRLSVSIGVASLESDSDSVDSLVKRADAAMYASKHGGRNRVSSMRFDF